MRERGWGEGSDGGERGRGEKGSVAGGYKTRCAGGEWVSVSGWRCDRRRQRETTPDTRRSGHETLPRERDASLPRPRTTCPACVSHAGPTCIDSRCTVSIFQVHVSLPCGPYVTMAGAAGPGRNRIPPVPRSVHLRSCFCLTGRLEEEQNDRQYSIILCF